VRDVISFLHFDEKFYNNRIIIGDFYKLKHCKSSNYKKRQTLQHIVNNFM